jgi:Beta-lactamase superfamily domain
MARLRMRLLGVGAMASPRYAPAGLLALAPSGAVAFDGGLAAVPDETAGRLSAWLVTDIRAELIADIRRSASMFGVRPTVSSYAAADLVVEPHPVVHTSHETWGYELRWEGRTAVWAPEFWRFPEWASGADLMFADAAGWSRPIRFRGGVGGHAAATDTAAAARAAGVRRLVFAHIGRPTIRALDTGEVPAFGEIGREGDDYWL